jgi:hypothetical protein
MIELLWPYYFQLIFQINFGFEEGTTIKQY